jgi:hypothetical protein
MTARGIDQILAGPSAPGLHEPYVTDAREYLGAGAHESSSVPDHWAARHSRISVPRHHSPAVAGKRGCLCVCVRDARV